MTIGERLKQIRKETGLTQLNFGEKIGLKSTIIGQMESNQRNITERTFILLKEKYNVNINYLLHGIGEMFIEPTTFSLDEYAQTHNLREMEVNLIRGFMELDPNVRNTLYDLFKKAFANETSQEEHAITSDLDIEKELEYYRHELELQKRESQKAFNTIKDTMRKKA